MGIFFAPPKNGPFALPPPLHGWCLPAGGRAAAGVGGRCLAKSSLGDVDAAGRNTRRKKSKMNKFCTNFGLWLLADFARFFSPVFSRFCAVLFPGFWPNLRIFLRGFSRFCTVFFFYSIFSIMLECSNVEIKKMKKNGLKI